MEKRAILVVNAAVVVTAAVLLFTPPELKSNSNNDQNSAPLPPQPSQSPSPAQMPTQSASSPARVTKKPSTGKQNSLQNSEQSNLVSKVEIEYEKPEEAVSSPQVINQPPQTTPNTNTVTNSPKPTPLTSQSTISIPVNTPSPTPQAPKPTPTPTPTPTPQPPKPTPTPTPTPVKQLINGTFTGDPINVGYGTVQVQISVSSSRIISAVALQSPTGGKSGSISSTAIPILSQRTIAAQSASISGVSGASFTSNGWIKSLTSAISRSGL